MGKLIAFSGLDGAGKTTQIELLRDYLTKFGLKSEIVWSRGGYTQGMQLLKKALRFTFTKSIPEAGRSEERKQKFDNPVVRKTWLFLSILDLLILYGIKFRIKRFFGKIVIADRYVHDTAIDFKINFPEENVQDWWIWQILKCISPDPDYYFVALIPIEESVKRSKEKDEPFPDKKEVLEFRKDCYKHLIENRSNIITIDGLKSVETIHSKILRNIQV